MIEIESEDNEEIQNKIKSTLEKYNEKQKYQVSKTTARYILLIGRTRTGKSTLKEMLTNPAGLTTTLNLHSETRNPEFQMLTVVYEGKLTTLAIIDTPGLFERSNNDKTNIRDNAHIISLIKLFVNLEITKIHVIFFVIRLESGIHDEDIKACLEFKDYIENFQNNCALLITGCESNSKELNDDLIEKFWQDSKVKEQKLKEFFRLGVYFSGRINHRDFEQGNDKTVYRQFNNVVRYRNELLSFIGQDMEPQHIDKTQMSTYLEQIQKDKASSNSAVPKTKGGTCTLF